MDDLRSNFCPCCTRMLCKGPGPIEIKCRECKATIKVEPDKMTVIKPPEYSRYKRLGGGGILNCEYGALKGREVYF